MRHAAESISLSPVEIVFARSGVSLLWDPACDSLLTLAQENGLDPPWSCRQGVCNSCLTTLLEGEVLHPADLLLQPPPGDVLLCCARPRTRRVVVDA